MATTFRKLSEIIIDRRFNGQPSDDASVSVRHVAELIAIEVAYVATMSAFSNSNAGEATYANDQFISVFNNLDLLTDGVTAEKYTLLPATPAGLPNNQEISGVAFTSCPNVKVVPLKQKDTFAQQYLDMPSKIYNYKIENGRIVFISLPDIVTGKVSVKLVGAVSGATLLDSVLNISKDAEGVIMDRVLLKLDPRRSVQRDINNDQVPLPN